MTVTTIDYIQVDDTPGIAKDVTGKMYRLVAVPEMGPAAAGAVPLADTNRTTAGASISGTLAHATGKLVYIRGFRVTAAPIAVSVSGEVTLSGLANGKTFSYELAALVGAIAQINDAFGDLGLAANDSSTDIVLTVPALALATISLDIWGHRI